MAEHSFCVHSCWLCGSRNIHTYPTEGIFFPHPSGNSNKASNLSLNLWVLRTTHPLGNSNPFCGGGGGGYGCFLDVRACTFDLVCTQGLQKTNVPLICNHFICSVPPLSVLLFFIIECGVLIVLAFYYKDILEKVTMQRIQQFSEPKMNPVKSSACVVSHLQRNCHWMHNGFLRNMY